MVMKERKNWRLGFVRRSFNASRKEDLDDFCLKIGIFWCKRWRGQLRLLDLTWLAEIS